VRPSEGSEGACPWTERPWKVEEALLLEPRTLVSDEEVAAKLNVKRSTVRAWARAGKLPSVRLSYKVIRFDPDVIDAWILEHATGETS
jgi:excisionase family DNA binding protein